MLLFQGADLRSYFAPVDLIMGNDPVFTSFQELVKTRLFLDGSIFLLISRD